MVGLSQYERFEGSGAGPQGLESPEGRKATCQRRETPDKSVDVRPALPPGWAARAGPDPVFPVPALGSSCLAVWGALPSGTLVNRGEAAGSCPWG